MLESGKMSEYSDVHKKRGVSSGQYLAVDQDQVFGVALLESSIKSYVSLGFKVA